MSDAVVVRDAEEADMAAVQAIYQHYVLNGVDFHSEVSRVFHREVSHL